MPGDGRELVGEVDSDLTESEATGLLGVEEGDLVSSQCSASLLVEGDDLADRVNFVV
jgi:hypothetical protein